MAGPRTSRWPRRKGSGAARPPRARVRRARAPARGRARLAATARREGGAGGEGRRKLGLRAPYAARGAGREGDGMVCRSRRLRDPRSRSREASVFLRSPRAPPDRANGGEWRASHPTRHPPRNDFCKSLRSQVVAAARAGLRPGRGAAARERSSPPVRRQHGLAGISSSAAGREPRSSAPRARPVNGGSRPNSCAPAKTRACADAPRSGAHSRSSPRLG